jgi:hypothetical protein
MNRTIKIFVRLAILIGVAAGIITMMKTEKKEIPTEGYIGRSEITVENGHMSPEALLAFGRLSDPQVSPDGKHIIYGVSYTSTPENRSVRNLFICNIDGSDSQQLTFSGKSISNARWQNDGSGIIS